MKNIYVIILVLMSFAAYGQSNLPACPGSDASKWNYCIGSIKRCSGPNSCEQYTGGFRNGRRNGIGQWTNDAGDFYFGEWLGGRYEGQGRLSEKRLGTGYYDRYVGEFKDGKFDGRGIEYRNTSTFFQSGIYKAGTLVTPQNIDLKSFTNIPFDIRDGKSVILQADVPDRDLRKYPPDDSGNWLDMGNSWQAKGVPLIWAIKPKPEAPKKSKLEEQQEKDRTEYLRSVGVS